MQAGTIADGSEPTERPLRVLLVGLNYAPEPIGIAPYTTGMAEFLAARGHQVAVVAGRPYYPQWRVPQAYRGLVWRGSHEHGVEIVRCPHYVPSNPTGLRRIVHHLSFAAAALAPALRRAWRDRPEVVICVAPSLVSAITARLAAALAGAPLWLHLQDFEVDAATATGLVAPGRFARLLAGVERVLLRQARVVSTISPQMVARLQVKGVPPERTFELRNWAADLTEGDSAAYRREWGLKGRFVALYSGTLARKQGVAILIEAAAHLAARDDIAVVICGEGPELEPLRVAAAGLGNVQFHPLQPAERLGDLLAAADVHLLPQVTAAADLVLPSKLTNMLRSGRPVVVTAELGTGLYAEAEGCGIATPPGDARALAEAVVRVADDPALARRLGEAGRRRAGKRWSREAILGAFEAQLKALAKPR